MGHDPQPRVGQASNQAITVKGRVDVAGHPARTDPGKGTLSGPSDSRVTHYVANNANTAVAGPRPAAMTLTGDSLGGAARVGNFSEQKWGVSTEGRQHRTTGGVGSQDALRSVSVTGLSPREAMIDLSPGRTHARQQLDSYHVWLGPATCLFAAAWSRSPSGQPLRRNAERRARGTSRSLALGQGLTRLLDTA
jgi:hypothetical protein